jgi:hypothetical protein
MTDPVVPPYGGGTVPPPGAPSFPPPGAGAQGYPPQGTPQQGFPGQGFSGQGFSQQSNPQQGFSQQSNPQQGFPGQGFSPQGSPQQGYAQQGNAPQGFPPPPAGGPGFPPPAGGPFPGGQFPGAPEPKPKKKFLGKALGILGTLAIIAIVALFKIGIGGALAGDPTKDAKAGDCIGIKSQMSEAATEVEAEMVECTSADAKYTVLGRVEGIKDINSPACDATFDEKLKEGEEGYAIASQEGAGYLLCLKSNA